MAGGFDFDLFFFLFFFRRASSLRSLSIGMRAESIGDSGAGDGACGGGDV